MIRVGVVRGGWGDEFQVSLETGASVLRNLGDDHVGIDVLIDKEGEWHIGGIPIDPDEFKVRVDVAFNALHGHYGEDGRVAQIFENLQVPYTGSAPLASSIAINKPLAKEVLKKAGFKTPPGMSIEDYRESTFPPEERERKVAELARKVFEAISPPWVVKPSRGGSSIGAEVATTFPELLDVLGRAFKRGGDLVVEQYMVGKEISVGLVDEFRNQDVYATMPVEVRKKGMLFDAEAKKAPSFACPGSLSRKEKEALADVAKSAYKHLGLRDYATADFIVTPRGAIYLLEFNNNPGLSPNSVMHEGLTAAGSSVEELVRHLVSLALARKYARIREFSRGPLA